MAQPGTLSLLFICRCFQRDPVWLFYAMERD